MKKQFMYNFKKNTMKGITLIIITAFIIPGLSIGQNYNIGELSLDLTDSNRNRPVKTELWYPTLDTDSANLKITELPFILEPTIRDAKFMNQKYPLIVLSHGTGGNRFSLAWLAISLVKHGYIVASPDHWGNTFDNKIPEYFVRYWERPLDISFIISQVLESENYSKYIDHEKIGVVGFSLGGYSTIALAGAEIDCNLLKSNAKTKEGKQEFDIPELGDLGKLIDKLSCDHSKGFHLKDNRIKAFVALAPALGLGFASNEQTKNIQSPLLIIGNEGDQIAPVISNAKKYNSLITSSKYIELHGKIGHYIFLNEANKDLMKEAKKYYTDDKSVNRKLIHVNVENLIIEFFDSNFKEKLVHNNS
jgi:predicted dienelactone hydrolase